MNHILTRIDKIVIDLFRSLYDKISDLRVVKRTNIKDNHTGSNAQKRYISTIS